MTPISIKTDWKKGDKLFASDLNNDFNSIEVAINHLIGNTATSGDLHVNSVTTVTDVTVGGTLAVEGAAVLSGDPVTAMGAATKQYVDGLTTTTLAAVTQTATSAASKLPLAGGTLTGPLTLSGAPVGSLEAATKAYVDSEVAGGGGGQGVLRAGDTMTGPLILSADPTANLGAATKQYADRMLPLTGGSMSGPIGLVSDPTLPMQPATKRYVDAATVATQSYAVSLQGYANVKTFGAVGTGGADDTAAVQAACNASRGVYFPPGVYNISGIALANGTSLVGSGAAATTIVKTSTTGNLFTFQGAANGVSDIQFVASGQTSGALFDFALGNNVLRGLLVNNGFDIVLFRSGVNTSISDCVFVNFLGTAVKYLNGYVGFASMSNVNIVGDGIAANNVGLWVQSGDTFLFSNVNIAGVYSNVVVQPPVNAVLANMFCTNMLADGVGGQQRTTGNSGWIIDGTASGATLDRLYLSNCWAGSNVLHGFQIQGASDVRLVACTSINNKGHGVWLGATGFPVAIAVQNCTISGNSAGNGGVNGGIYVDTGVSDFRITGCRIGQIRGISNNQKYGIWIPGTANDHYIVSDNAVWGNVTAGIFDAGAGPNKAFSNNLAS